MCTNIPFHHKFQAKWPQRINKKCKLIWGNLKCRARIQTDPSFLQTPQLQYQHLYHLHQLPQSVHYFISIIVLTTSWEFDMEENLLVSVGVEWGAKQRLKSVQTQEQGPPIWVQIELCWGYGWAGQIWKIKSYIFFFSDQSLKFGPNSGQFSQMSQILILTRVFRLIGSHAERAV